VWDAPVLDGALKAGWSTDSTRVALAPSVLPPAEAEHGSLPANAAVSIEIKSGHVSRIPVDGKAVREFRWHGNGELAVLAGESGAVQHFLLGADGWRPSAPPLGDGQLASVASIRVTQDVNTPPKLVSFDSQTQRETILLDPNVELVSKYRLGKVLPLSGHLATGEGWTATLYLPSDYIQSNRYPLVIQSQGGGAPVSATKFSLYGWSEDSGLGPCDIAPYVAQLLASRGIAVLQLGVDAEYGGPGERETTQRAFEELSERLVADGTADRRRIGLSGFSRTGYFVLNALTRSRFPFAAAVVVDNYDPSYIQATLLNGYTYAESTIGASAFGTGLQKWLERAPGFNVDHINAPLLLEGQSGGARENILWQWEILSRLRRLNRPVEMYLMPGITAHPSHSMQNPAQVIAIQEKTLEWFDFWLNGRETKDPKRAEQYSRWRALRLLNDPPRGPDAVTRSGDASSQSSTPETH